MNCEMSSHVFNSFRGYIKGICGVDFHEDKAYLLQSRLSGLLAELGLYSFEDLYGCLRESCDKRLDEKVIDAVTTSETFWFRDKTPWNILENVLLPGYISEFRALKRRDVRIWSAACASGQEPYSTAMCIDRHLSGNSITDIGLSNFEITATDISWSIIQMAGLGRYDAISISRGLDESWRDRYFKSQGRVWELEGRIRSSVRFMQFNLQSDFEVLGRFDVIFLRNVMIYFSDKLKKEVLKKAAAALKPGGVMFLGSSELLLDTGGSFAARRYGDGIYYEVKR